MREKNLSLIVKQQKIKGKKKKTNIFLKLDMYSMRSDLARTSKPLSLRKTFKPR